MYLSKLEIFGFKSFGRKTTFVFNDGITAVVGPNGCGKSNIVDAIRWVLGEQKTGILRSDRMEDVIFAGSKTVKPLGMAEVTLTIENTKNVLPVEYAEVAVTRRLFRSGESQYLLNSSPCRLKDIMDLFMDTGMGADAYSVIELSMVESLLNGKHEERRHIFEEAAGVTKYKVRKKAAERKLEATEEDLKRLGDIIAEVERNVASLARQVSKARRYQRLAEALKRAELQAAAYRYREVLTELTPLETRLMELGSQRQELTATVAKDEAALEALRTDLLALDGQLRETQQRFNEATAAIQKREEELLVLRERLHALDEKRGRLAQEEQTWQERAARLAEQLKIAEERLTALTKEVEQLEGRALAAGEEAKNVEAELINARLETRALDQSLRRLLRDVAEKRQNEERLRALLQSLTDREERARVEQTSHLQTLEGARRSIEEMTARREQLDEQRKHLLARREALETEIAEIDGRLSHTLEALRQVNVASASAAHRVDLLERFLQAYEDHPEGVRFLMAEMAQELGLHGTLADVLTVEERYRRAIEAALADGLHSLVVEHTDNALRAIEALKRHERGWAGFLPLERFNGGDLPTRRPVEDHPGVVGWADQLVQHDPSYSPLIRRLLGQYLLVENLDVAKHWAERLAGDGVDVVTLDGEVITHWGMLRGGLNGKDDESLLGKRDQLRRLQRQREELRQELEARRKERDTLEKARVEKLQERDRYAQELRSVEERFHALEVQLAQRQSDLESHRERADRARLEQLEVQQERLRLECELEGLTSEIASLEVQRKDLEERLAERQHALEIGEKEQARTLQQAHQLHLTLARLQGEKATLIEQLQHARQLLSEAQETITQRRKEDAGAADQKAALLERLDGLKMEIERQHASQEAVASEIARLEQDRRDLTERIARQEASLKERRRDREAAAEAFHHTELKLSELRAKAEHLRARAAEEYHVELREVVIVEPVDLPTLERTIDELRERRQSLGTVNLLALEDHEREKERLRFLVAQRNDLLEAKQNLTQTIERIHQTAVTRFLEVFQQVRENFERVFQEFFSGGEADLRLGEGDPLEAEIQIAARPKGKRLEALSLLSGGEKALTAISLLFAIYLVKPSPFCILDEVDAPLDDVNISRFIHALQKFSDNTQFIIVTHNKLTMKAADSLYGITMDKDGISQVVSVRFADDSARPVTESAAGSSRPG